MSIYLTTKSLRTLNKKRRRITTLTAGVLALSTMTLGLGATGAAAAKRHHHFKGSPINVGVVSAFTGPAAFIGQTFLTGATTAETLINNAGGVNGHKINLKSADDGGDPVDAVTVVRQMLALDNVSGVLGLAAPDYPNALPILNQAKMVSFTHIGDPSLDTKRMPYSFRSQPSDAVVGTAMAYYASTRHYKKVAIALDATQGSQTLLKPLTSALKKLKIKVVANVTLPVSAGSYVAEIQHIVSAHPQAILLQTSQTDQAGTFGTEIQQNGGGKIPVIGSDLTAAADWVNAVGPAYDKAEVTSVIPANSSGPGVKLFLKEFEKLYHKGPEDVAPNMYDSLNIMALAMDMAHSNNPKKYVKYVTKVTTPGRNVTTVYSYAQGLKLLKKHKRIKYYGVASPDTFTKFHTVSGAFQAVKGSSSGATHRLHKIPANKLQKLLTTK